MMGGSISSLPMVYPSLRALSEYYGDGRFKDVAPELSIDSLEQHGAVAAGDLDNDGDLDLALTKDCSLGTLKGRWTCFTRWWNLYLLE